MKVSVLASAIVVIMAALGVNRGAAQTQGCDPVTSAQDLSMKTMDNRWCYFPFVYENTTYTDCAGDARKWCATTCNFNRDGEFSFCRYEKKNLQSPTCRNLNETQPYSIPETMEGKRCVFPFVYENKCFNGCTREGGVNLWCATTSSMDIYPKEFDNCHYNREILNNPDCANVSDSQKYSYPETVTGAKCVFPFIYNDVCKTECVVTNDDNPWCATNKIYTTSNWVYCKHFFDVRKYGTILKHGLYNIYANCSNNAFCNGTVVSSTNANNSILFLVKDKSPYQVTTWEVIPQPDSTVIIRVPLIHMGQNATPPAWTISSALLITLKTLSMYKENVRFVLNNAGRPNAFILSKIVDNTTTLSSMVGFRHRVNDIRSFIPLEEVPIKQFWRFELVKEFSRDDLKVGSVNGRESTMNPIG